MIHKIHIILITFFSIISSTISINASEQQASSSTSSSKASHLPKGHSSLRQEWKEAIDDASMAEDMRALFSESTKPSLIQVVSPDLVVKQMPTALLRWTWVHHKDHHFEVNVCLGPLHKAHSTAIIDAYNARIPLSQASEALYRNAGKEYYDWLKAFHRQHRDYFATHMNIPGSSMVVPQHGQTLGDVAVQRLALMYVPRCTKPAQQLHTIKFLASGLSSTIIHKLYPEFETMKEEASVIIAAPATDHVFGHYPQATLARSCMQSVLATLRYLHVLGFKKIKYVGFIVDNDESYQHYAKALQEQQQAAPDFLDIKEINFQQQ